MATSISESVTIDIDGKTFDAVVNVDFIKGFKGDHTTPAEPDEYEFHGLEIKVGNEYFAFDDYLVLPHVHSLLLEQVQNAE